MPAESTSYFHLRMPMEVRLRPWIRAETLEWTDLYWKAVTGFPCRHFEKVWEAAFLAQLAEELAAEGLEPCCFLETACLQGELGRKWQLEAETLAPVPGYSRQLWDPPPGLPPQETLDAIVSQKMPFQMEIFSRGLAIWVEPPDLREFVLQYGGSGGFAVLFLPPAQQEDAFDLLPQALLENPFFANVAPGVDLRRELRGLRRMQDPRMERLKQIFIRGWESFSPARHIPFIVPMLRSLDFFQRDRAVLEEYFSVAPVSIFESRPDAGLLLAASSFPPDRLSRLMHGLRKALDQQPQRTP